MPVYSHYRETHKHRHPSSLPEGQQYVVHNGQLVAVNSNTNTVIRDANGNIINYTNYNNAALTRPAITSSASTVDDIYKAYSVAVFNEQMYLPRAQAIETQIQAAVVQRDEHRTNLRDRVRAQNRPGSAVDLIEWEGTNPGTTAHSQLLRDKRALQLERLYNVNMALGKMKLIYVNIPAGQINEATRRDILLKYNDLLALRDYLNSSNPGLYNYPVPDSGLPHLVASNPVLDTPSIPTPEVKTEPAPVVAEVTTRQPINLDELLPKTDVQPAVEQAPVDQSIPAVLPAPQEHTNEIVDGAVAT